MNRGFVTVIGAFFFGIFAAGCAAETSDDLSEQEWTVEQTEEGIGKVRATLPDAGTMACLAADNKPVVIDVDGPDGGTCTITGTTDCAMKNGSCSCSIIVSTTSGDCTDDGTTTSLTPNP